MDDSKNIGENIVDKPLKGKRAIFVLEYLKDLNATQAAIRAGYSRKTAEIIGFENLRKPKIQAAIKKAMDERSEKTRITAESILNGISETVDRCRQAIEVLGKDGNPTGEWKFDATNTLKGYELLGRHLGMWESKKTEESLIRIVRVRKSEDV